MKVNGKEYKTKLNYTKIEISKEFEKRLNNSFFIYKIDELFSKKLITETVYRKLKRELFHESVF